MRSCWCGNSELIPFNAEYGECSDCGTLVSLAGISTEELQVSNDETDFYGKQYWLDHQSGDLGLPDIYKRARYDLTERNLHWLKALLKYRLPPSKVIELGCSHGSFVALLRQAGYDASGIEMSPWVVEFGQKTFGVSISIGPVEALEVSLASLDVIVLMDVLEHLPTPVVTMAHCLKLLKPDGVLLIQTPQFKPEISYAELLETKARFPEMLIPDEHIYLFSDQSITRLFRQLGAEHIQFEPAIFDHYDMFLAVSRTAFQTRTPEQVESALLDTPNGRLTLAILDVRERELEVTQKLQESEGDRVERAEQIETLTTLLKGSEGDRSDRAKQIETLTTLLKESEGDRSDRAKQIETLTTLLKESEADRSERARQIETLTTWLKESEADRSERAKQIETLTTNLRDLFGRPAFRWVTRFSTWPEVKTLAEQIGISSE